MRTFHIIVLSGAALLAGCGTTPPALPPPVPCIAELTVFVDETPWFENWVDENGNANHCDGVSPSATFRLVSPASFTGKVVTITFRAEGKDLPQPPSSSTTGTLFAIELPRDFLEGDYSSIHNMHVNELRIKP